MAESQTRQMQQVVDHLRRDFPRLPDSELERAVVQGFREFHDVSVRDYLPVLVERRLRGELRAQRLG